MPCERVSSNTRNTLYYRLRDEIYTDAAHRLMNEYFNEGKLKKADIEPLITRLYGTTNPDESMTGTLLGLAKTATYYAEKNSLDLFSLHVVEFFGLIEGGLRRDGRIREVDSLIPRLLVECRKFNDETVLYVLADLVIFTLIELGVFKGRE
jgi:hypothetical protein